MGEIILVLLLLFGIPTTVDNPNQAISDELLQLTPEEFLKLLDQEVTIHDVETVDIVHNGEYLIDSYQIPVDRTVTLSDYLDYDWTLDDINYAALLVDTESLVLGEVGMMSSLSTAFARYISPIWCQSYYCSDLLYEEILRPNQFHGPLFSIKNGRSFARHDVSYLAVYKFILGLEPEKDPDITITNYSDQESCMDFEFFNSTPDGYGECIIETTDGRYVMNFYSRDRFSTAIEEGDYRNK